MFADSLLDSAWAQDSRRGWSTVLSFSIQGLAVAVLLLLPLVYGEKLPAVQWMQTLVAPAPLPAPMVPAQMRRALTAVSNLAPDGQVLQPPNIPRDIAQVDEAVAPMPDSTGIGVIGSTGTSSGRGSVIQSILSAAVNVLPPPVRPVAVRPILTSQLMEGFLLHKVQPQYPPLARQARIQGAVVLQAVISRDGTIERLQVFSGHPMLIPSALAAVRLWRYRPYLLNGEPVEVETQVTVNFVLGGG